MTKKDLLKWLEGVDDDTPIRVTRREELESKVNFEIIDADMAICEYDGEAYFEIEID